MSAPSWGKQVTKKALQGLVHLPDRRHHLHLVRFEPKMALAAIIALIHDLIITAGIYSLARLRGHARRRSSRC